MCDASATPKPVIVARRPSPATALLLVLLTAVVLRLASALTLGDVDKLHGDEGYYVRAARALAAGEGYPGALRPPGYPAFVAGALAIAGGSLRAARLVQIGAALLGVALLAAIVRQRFGPRAAAISALLVAVDPTLVFYSHLFWSETLVATLLLGVVFGLDRFDLVRRDAWLVATGAVLGAAVLTRDMLLFFVPVVVAWTWLVPGLSPRIALRRALLVLVPVLLVVAPWMLRNQALLGRPLLLSTNSWYPLAVGNLIPRDRVLGMGDENRAFVPAYYDVPGELARAAFAREAALRAIAERQPGWIFRKLARNTYYLFSTASQLQRFVKEDWLASGWRDVGRRLVRVEITFYLLQMTLGLVALWLVPGGRVKLLVVALLLFHWAVYVVANATNRFRVPLLPFFALYSGPLLLGYGRRGRTAAWRLTGAGASVATLVVIVATPFVRRLLVLLAVLAGPLALAGCRDAGPGTVEDPAPTEAVSMEPGARPNVVLISIDTLRADHLGTYGYARPTSPNIDALARRGVTFERATSPSSWTLPAHASMLTGVSPYRHGATSEATRIRDDVPLLAELLRAHGYHTAAFVNAPFVSRRYGFARGFASFDQRFEERRSDIAQRQAVITRAVDGLEPPFFLFLHFMDVHTPYRPPKQFNVFARDRRSKQVLKDLGEGGVLALQRAAREGRLQMSPEARDRLIDLYDGEILALDHYIGELVRAIDARFPETIVILTADHGEEFLEHGGFGHGDTLFEEVLHVPLIVAGGGLARGVRVGDLVSLVDVPPTILALAGAPVPPGLDGRSLTADLAGRADAATRARADATERTLALHTASHDGTLSLRGVRRGDRKLLRDDRKQTSALYDLAADPGEHEALAPTPGDSRLEQALMGLGVVTPGVAVPAPDAKTVESLKALGYL